MPITKLEIDALAPALIEIVEQIKEKPEDNALQENALNKLMEMNALLNEWRPTQLLDHEILEGLAEKIAGIFSKLNEAGRIALAEFNSGMLIYYTYYKKSSLRFIPHVATTEWLEEVESFLPPNAVKFMSAILTQRLLHEGITQQRDPKRLYDDILQICSEVTSDFRMNNSLASVLALQALAKYDYAKITKDQLLLKQALTLSREALKESHSMYRANPLVNQVAIMLGNSVNLLLDWSNNLLAKEIHREAREAFQTIDGRYISDDSVGLIPQAAAFYQAYGDFLLADFTAIDIWRDKKLGSEMYRKGLSYTPSDSVLKEKYQHAFAAYEQEKITTYMADFDKRVKKLDEGLTLSQRTENYYIIMKESPDFYHREANKNFKKALKLGEKYPQFVIDQQLHSRYTEFLMRDYSSIGIEKSNPQQIRQVIKDGLKLNPKDPLLTRQLSEIDLAVSIKSLNTLSIVGNINKTPVISRREEEKLFRCTPQK